MLCEGILSLNGRDFHAGYTPEEFYKLYPEFSLVGESYGNVLYHASGCEVGEGIVVDAEVYFYDGMLLSVCLAPEDSCKEACMEWLRAELGESVGPGYEIEFPWGNIVVRELVKPVGIPFSVLLEYQIFT